MGCVCPANRSRGRCSIQGCVSLQWGLRPIHELPGRYRCLICLVPDPQTACFLLSSSIRFWPKGFGQGRKGSVMRSENYLETSQGISPADDAHVAEDFVWATSEKAKDRSLSLFLIQSIVEKHGGTVEVNLATNTISIDVPKRKQAACAQEIEEQVGHICE
jgi:hypothetical protein